jgi:putative tryptophan/tyrosine transport system substrate-binding protein
MDRRPQPRNSFPLGWWRPQPNAGLCGRTGEFESSCHLCCAEFGVGGSTARDPHHTGGIRADFRSGRRRICHHLAHPGGNITGFALFEFAIGAKWLELLKQIAPSVTRAAVIYDPANPSASGFLPLIEAAGRSFGVDVFVHSVHDTSEIEDVISALTPNSGLIGLASPLVTQKRDLIISLANRSRLPAIFALRYYAEAGALASYGVDNLDLYRRAGAYVDRILKGEKPSDLPVQQATKFQLVINLKTAKTLGLTVPSALLAAADEVIE